MQYIFDNLGSSISHIRSRISNSYVKQNHNDSKYLARELDIIIVHKFLKDTDERFYAKIKRYAEATNTSYTINKFHMMLYAITKYVEINNPLSKNKGLQAFADIVFDYLLSSYKNMFMEHHTTKQEQEEFNAKFNDANLIRKLREEIDKKLKDYFKSDTTKKFLQSEKYDPFYFEHIIYEIGEKNLRKKLGEIIIQEGVSKRPSNYEDARYDDEYRVKYITEFEQNKRLLRPPKKAQSAPQLPLKRQRSSSSKSPQSSPKQPSPPRPARPVLKPPPEVLEDTKNKIKRGEYSTGYEHIPAEWRSKLGHPPTNHSNHQFDEPQPKRQKIGGKKIHRKQTKTPLTNKNKVRKRITTKTPRKPVKKTHK